MITDTYDADKLAAKCGVSKEELINQLISTGLAQLINKAEWVQHRELYDAPKPPGLKSKHFKKAFAHLIEGTGP
ncbi:hypothetical protein [Flexibacterium corallicola]|uniref:hypothetical protein n=1 Tax=Flexibacterium corallicola TaxID=3037259 RepID=UPI00286F3334|nr:hypothetical protein [Pseudovibrio sp. M1P-2-3]